MDMEKQKLLSYNSHVLKNLHFCYLFGLIGLISCNLKQAENDNKVLLKNSTTILAEHDSLFLERIIDVYQETENLDSNKHFLFISTELSSDSISIIHLSYFYLYNSVDSGVLKYSHKTSKYNGMKIYSDIESNSFFPVPTRLKIVQNSIKEERPTHLLPYNEYFNNIDLIYSVKDHKILGIFEDDSTRAEKYKASFKLMGLMRSL